jgi:hypothetical protein
MAALTLPEAADRLAMSPLQVAVQCALRGVPCAGGFLDEEVLPVLGNVRAPLVDSPDAVGYEAPPAGETDQGRRERVVRRVLEKMATMGKYWPARAEKRSTARGFDGSDVGLALDAADVLRDCGYLIEEARGGREARVGLDGSLRREIADMIAGHPATNQELREWIERG